MIEFNPGLSHILRKVFFSKNMQLELTNTVEPLIRETIMIKQNVTLSNTQEGKIQKRNEILILD